MLRKLLTLCVLTLCLCAPALWAQARFTSAERGGPLPPPLPLFPADNWWNQDVTDAPVDPRSAQFISFINNGGSRPLHPDFGGYESPASIGIYGSGMARITLRNSEIYNTARDPMYVQQNSIVKCRGFDQEGICEIAIGLAEFVWMSSAAEDDEPSTLQHGSGRCEG